MSYAVPLERECTEDGCHRRATYEVRNSRNEPIRVCCRRHAEQLVKRLDATP